MADLNGSDNAEYRKQPRAFYPGKAHKNNVHFQGYNNQIKKHVTGFNVQCNIFVFFFPKKKEKKKEKKSCRARTSKFLNNYFYSIIV